MIIFRYLARTVLANTLGVAAVLMLVVVSSRFVKYLAEAAAGKLDPSVLLAVIGFRLPGFFELILPLAFFLAILLAYGQLYVSSEMTVLHACGFSQSRLLLYTLTIALLVAAIVAGLSLGVSPSGYARVQQLFDAQRQRGELEGLQSGRFYTLRSNRGVTYAEQVGEDGRLRQVFLAQQPGNGDEGLVVVVAEQGASRQSDSSGERYLVLDRGQRIQGVPGQADFHITRFEVFGQRLEPVAVGLDRDVDGVPTRELLHSDQAEHRAALVWRLSHPVMVMVVALLAVPLSRTNPRQGRFSKVLPAVVLYVLYLAALNAVRGEMEDGEPRGALLMGAVHGLFLAVGLVMAVVATGWRPLRRKG